MKNPSNPGNIFPEIAEENKNQLKNLYEAFVAAKKRIDLINSNLKYYKKIDIPSINELRYVSFHTLKALTKTNHSDQDEELRRAKRHCERASYDALELGINDQIEFFEKFKETHNDVCITSIVKNWPDVCEKISQINDALAEINRNDQVGEENFSLAEDKYHELCDITDLFPAHTTELNNKKQENRRLKNQILYSIYFGFLAIILLIIKIITA